MASCDVCNDRFAYLDKRLRYKPVDSEELVEHREFAQKVPDDIVALEEQVQGRQGICDSFRAIHSGGMQVEYLSSQPGAPGAFGP